VLCSNAVENVRNASLADIAAALPNVRLALEGGHRDAH
jgi:hypothetical protein